uniref:Uncharacterized protein n=1 Tax=Glossina brevipalpis TaxID=37001 RepID=A0A1A9WIW8_9MUSC
MALKLDNIKLVVRGSYHTVAFISLTSYIFPVVVLHKSLVRACNRFGDNGQLPFIPAILLFSCNWWISEWDKEKAAHNNKEMALADITHFFGELIMVLVFTMDLSTVKRTIKASLMQFEIDKDKVHCQINYFDLAATADVTGRKE